MTDQSIIFFDIDGTLLNDEKQLPESAKEAVFKLKEKGHIVAIATGRAPFMFKDLRAELEIDTYISYNGQYVVLNGEVLYTNSLKIQSLERLTEEALLHNHPVLYMDHEDMKANVPEHPYIHESISTLKVNHFPTHDPSYYIGRELYQSIVFCEEGKEEYYRGKYQDFDFVRWHPLAVDVIPKGGSKAKGIEKMIEKLGFPRERQYAFGDGPNDIEMLTEIYNSIAMGNAVESAKSAAKYVTKSVDNHGIQYGLEMVGLL